MTAVCHGRSWLKFPTYGSEMVFEKLHYSALCSEGLEIKGLEI